VVYLHYAQAIGIERLRALMGEVFGLSISEGTLCNILAGAQALLGAAGADIAIQVIASVVVASDETSVRVKGKTDPPRLSWTGYATFAACRSAWSGVR